MPVSVTYNSELRIIESNFRGVVTFDDIECELTEAHRLAGQHNCHCFLADLQAADLRISLLDVYETPKMYDDLGGEQSGRLAMIPPADQHGSEVVRFFETVFRNFGWEAERFTTRQEAVAWLRSKTPDHDANSADHRGGQSR